MHPSKLPIEFSFTQGKLSGGRLAFAIRWTYAMGLTVRWSAISLVAGWLLCSLHPIAAQDPTLWPMELKVAQFEIHCDFELTETESLAAELQAMARDIESLIGKSDRIGTVHIVLFETADEYARYMRNYFPKLPQRRALYIQDRGPGMLFTHWHREVATDLRHEITHALLNDQAHAVPLWLDEGLAEYFEVAGALRFDGNPYLQAVKARSHSGIVPALEQLEQIPSRVSLSDEQYRDSWSWVHYALHRNQATRDLLARFLRSARSGTPQLELSRQLGQIVPDLREDYIRHFAAFSGSELARQPADVPPATLAR